MPVDPSIRALFGEPPAGINLEESRVDVNNGAVIAMLCLAAVAAIMRFVARAALRNPFKADDWLVIGSLVCVSISILAVSANLSRSLLSVSRPD